MHMLTVLAEMGDQHLGPIHAGTSGPGADLGMIFVVLLAVMIVRSKGSW